MSEFELECITSTIIHEVSVLKLKQADIAKTYALAIKSHEQIDWPKINAAIVERWSRSGLDRIKTMAWKL